MSAAAIPGSVTIAPRALTHLTRAVVRDLLGTPMAETSVEVGTSEGGLALRISTRVPLHRFGGLLAHLHQVRSDLASRVGALSDRQVSSVDLRITGVCVAPVSRVQ